MRKLRCLAIALIVCMIAPLFAASKSAGITDDDVKNFAKNYSDIENIVDDLDIHSTISGSGVSTDLEKQLGDCGISDPNRTYKIAMIMVCFIVEFCNQNNASDTDVNGMISDTGFKTLAEMRSAINDADRKVVARHMDALTNAMSK